MSNNPYQTPPQAPYGGPGYGPGKQQNYGRGFVQQIPVISALMIVQGVLYLLLAMLMFGYAFFFSQMDKFMPAGEQAEFREQFQQSEGIVVSIVSGSLCLVAFTLATMHFISAYFGFTYRYRVFGIITMILGLGSVMTCYCAPTAIGLAVYGLIIYFNPAVAKAFTMAKSGMNKSEILDQFPG